jgi:hypothetical protein
MNAEMLRNNWALALAAFVGLVIVVLVLRHVVAGSAAGQLRRTRTRLAAERRNLRRATLVVARAENRLRELEARVDKVKPRHRQESREALEDATALAKIAQDKVLIAENHVRRVILEEFPPSEHQRLRAKCLPEALPDKRPFSF